MSGGASPVSHHDPHRHLLALCDPLVALAHEAERITAWGRRLAETLTGGGRLLVAGNGGSAAQAQHLTSELVGRYRDDRPPFSAMALHAETSSVTAVANDYGYEEVFGRQVRAHGRDGDILIVLSTSGRSPNIAAAVRAARPVGMTTWALCGPAPNLVEALCHDALCVEGTTATVQEVHQVAIHLLCEAFEAAAFSAGQPAGAESGSPAAVVRTARRRPARGQPLVVVGDALLDCDLDGDAARLCPDAPVPVVDQPRRLVRPGGAALAAALAARAEGGDRPVVLVSPIGDDGPGRELQLLIQDAGVELIALPTDGATAEKLRIRAAGHQLLRVDRGGARSVPLGLPDAARRVISDASAVLVSDYGRGATGCPALREALAGAGGPVVWDPHPRGSEPLAGARLVTPNRSEAGAFASVPAEDVAMADAPHRGMAAVAAQARELLHRWAAASVVVTLGADGAVMVSGDGLPLVVPASEVVSGDPCGAGDRFAAAAAAALAGGALPSEAVQTAVAAATRFIARGELAGVGAVSGDALVGDGVRMRRIEAEPGEPRRAVVGRAAAADLIRRIHERGGTVVATGGCFDLLHAGHVAMLAAARALGDCLIVCLNSDESVTRLKGPGRPVVGQADRSALLAALGVVDAVVVFDDETPAPLLTELRPDLFVKGGDYDAGSLPEAAVMARWGGQAVTVPYLDGRSTTGLLQRRVSHGH